MMSTMRKEHTLLDCIIFWKSDDRWVNRSKALAVGILTYSAFKQRRRIGRVVASPIREIVHAIIPRK